MDDLYDETTALNRKATQKLRSLGQVIVGNAILNAHLQIEKLCESSGNSFTNLLFERHDTRGKSKIYVSLILAILSLKKDGYVINDYSRAALALRGSGESKRLFKITKNNNWDSKIRKDSIKYFKGVLKPALIREGEVITDFDEQTSKVLHVLDKVSEVGVETQMVEFKVGITTLTQNTLNKSVIMKSVQSLIAMSNTVLDEPVYVILGIADNEKSANDFKKHYSTSIVGFGNCLITGVDSEVERYFNGSLDNYVQQIQNIIYSSPIRERIKNSISSKIKIIKVCGKTLVVLQFKNQNCPSNYDGAFWLRTFNNNKRIELNSEFYFDYVEAHWAASNPVSLTHPL